MDRFLLFGLGNPGNQFVHTRHNVGADMVLAWIEYMESQGARVSQWKTHEKFHARVCEVTLDDRVVIVLSQIVFMNDSGRVLSAYLRYNEIDMAHILVVHDDLELPLAEVKIQETGSAHGHNGIRSVLEHMGNSDIARLRIGIGRPSDATPVEKFVLSSFSPSEKELLHEKEPEILQMISDRLLGE